MTSEAHIIGPQIPNRGKQSGPEDRRKRVGRQPWPKQVLGSRSIYRSVFLGLLAGLPLSPLLCHPGVQPKRHTILPEATRSDSQCTFPEACHLSGMAQPASQRTMVDSLLVPMLRETIFFFSCGGKNRNNRRKDEEEKKEKVFDPKDL